jgi:hypothetical protein
MRNVLPWEVAVAIDRAPDHNPDIAADIHLSSAEAAAGRVVRRRKAQEVREFEIVQGSLGALRELQLWMQRMQTDVALVRDGVDGVDARLRRLEAATAADDMAIDDLRDLIDELRTDLDMLAESRGAEETQA